MKVDIKRSEQTRGLFKKTTEYHVSVSVQFSEEEKKVIEECDISGNVICERPTRAGMKAFEDPSIFHLRVLSLLKDKPDVFEFENLADANEYNDAIPPSLKNLKDFIERNSSPQEDTSFEL